MSVPADATSKLNAPVSVVPSIIFVTEFVAVHVRSIGSLFGTLQADGTSEPVGR